MRNKWAGGCQTVRLWQVSTGRELLVFKDLPHKVNSVAFSADCRHLAAAIHDASVRLWHAAEGGMTLTHRASRQRNLHCAHQRLRCKDPSFV
ncbi:MAG TPA: hypothetical protein VGY58_23800 [Gemmataceae bacterium]|jgi:WD40 repeat protein|nr:hypothetical protein [Gemmataceae bacterium]